MKKKFLCVVALCLLIIGVVTTTGVVVMPEPEVLIKEVATYNC